MVHIFFFIQILTLFACGAIVIEIRRIGKSSPDPYFIPLLAYAGFTTAGVLLNVLSNYLIANIENFKGDFSATAGTAAGFVLECGSVLALLSFLFRLKGKKPSPGVAAAASGFLLAAGILHLAGIVTYQINAPLIHICPYRAVMLSPVIVLLAALLWFLGSAGSESLLQGGKRAAVCLLVGYSILALCLISNGYPQQLNAVLRLGFLGIVYFWYRAHRGSQKSQAVPDIGAIVEILGGTYGLSKREKEVLALLLGGKKNREIEAALFLSSSTVRNHISSLYGKIGIDSRGQLTSLALKLRKS